MSLLLALLALLFGGFGLGAGASEYTPDRELPPRTDTYSAPTPAPAPPLQPRRPRGTFYPHFA